MQILVLAKHDQPQMPCHPARARQLLTEGRAVIQRTMPLLLRLKDQEANAGSHRRLVIRARDSFNIQTKQGGVQGIPHRYCQVVQRGAGYTLQQPIANQQNQQRKRKQEAPCAAALSIPGLKAELSRANR